MKKQINIAVFVSGGGTNLQALIEAERRGDIKSGKIVLVLSNNENAYALERARTANIEALAVTKKGKPAEEFEREVLAALQQRDIDMIVLAGFLCVLSADFVSHYKDRIINIHPSLIPSFCGKGFYGLKVHEAALARGVKVTGATVHFVNEIPDGGKIILQKAVEIAENDTAETLQLRVMENAEWLILPRATEIVANKILENK